MCLNRGLGSIVTDNGTQIRNVERGISLIPLRNLHSGMHCSVKSKYLKSTSAVGARGEYFIVSQESTAQPAWAQERLVPDVSSIQVYYASVFCHNNHCLCYLF